MLARHQWPYFAVAGPETGLSFHLTTGIHAAQYTGTLAAIRLGREGWQVTTEPHWTTGYDPARVSRLPAQLNSFIGREQEIVRVNELLAETRLLTLTGAGGAGKTRLALRVAGDLAGALPDGVWLVQLAAVGDGALVATLVASALGLEEQPTRGAL